MGSKAIHGSGDGRITFHLTPHHVWQKQTQSRTYEPEAFEADGFIHCTDGEENVLSVGNAFYQRDPRPYVMLSITISLVHSNVIYEDPQEIYPHIYGPLNVDAVARVHKIVRDRDGVFLAIGDLIANPWS